VNFVSLSVLYDNFSDTNSEQLNLSQWIQELPEEA